MAKQSKIIKAGSTITQLGVAFFPRNVSCKGHCG